MSKVQLQVTGNHYVHTLDSTIDELEQELVQNMEFETIYKVQLAETEEEFNTAMEVFLDHPVVRSQLRHISHDPRNFIQKVMERFLKVSSHPTRDLSKVTNHGFFMVSWEDVQNYVNECLDECSNENETVYQRQRAVKRLTRFLLAVPSNDFETYETRYSTIYDELYKLKERNKVIPSRISELRYKKSEFLKFSPDLSETITITL